MPAAGHWAERPAAQCVSTEPGWHDGRSRQRDWVAGPLAGQNQGSRREARCQVRSQILKRSLSCASPQLTSGAASQPPSVMILPASWADPGRTVSASRDHIPHQNVSGLAPGPPFETRVRTLPWASSGHVTRSMSPQRLRYPMLTFATKKLSTGANGQKEDAASPFVRAFTF